METCQNFITYLFSIYRLAFAIIILRYLEARDFKQSCVGKCDDNSRYEAFCIGGLLDGNLEIQNLTISNWCENTFNLTYLGLWPNLRYFALIQSPVTNLVGAIPKSSKLQVSYAISAIGI